MRKRGQEIDRVWELKYSGKKATRAKHGIGKIMSLSRCLAQARTFPNLH